VKGLALLWLCGLTLRMTVLAIPPLLPQLHEAFALSQTAVAALTSMPVLLFSFAAIPGSLLVTRYGAVATLFGGILVTGAAGAARALSPDLATLFATTFAMGVSISIMQPAFPAIVREWVPERIALGTAMYSNGLLVGEALSASLTIPWVLPAAGGDWRLALAAWSAPVLAIAAMAWWQRPRRAGHRHAAAAAGARRWWPDWRDPLTWKLGLLMGYASSLYFGANAFLPDYLAARGRADLLNAALSALNWVQMPASVLLLVFARRLTMKRAPFIVLQAISLAALAGLLAMDGAWIVIWAGVMGFCNAFLLILALALPPLIAESDDVHNLAAGMIAIGYLCAFVIPIAGGAMWDATGWASAAYLPLACFALAAIGVAATLDFRERTILRP
jgi:CP family cyanate transporter-like MFS transporter